MTRNRQIAGILWAAIVLIAVQFVPAAAQAHGGHPHGSVSVSDQAQDTTDTTGQHTSELALAGAEGAPQSLNRGFGDRSGSSGLCPGGCCGQGMPCCGALCTADWYDHAPLPPRAADASWPVTADLSGMDPEARPKPPKSFV